MMRLTQHHLAPYAAFRVKVEGDRWQQNMKIQKSYLFLIVVVAIGCTKSQDLSEPPQPKKSPEQSVFYLSKTKLEAIVAQSYSNMMAQTEEGMLWDNRKAFTNYVLHCYYQKTKPLLEVQLTDASYDTATGYRYHRCIYDFEAEVVTFKKGLCTAVQ